MRHGPNLAYGDLPMKANHANTTTRAPDPIFAAIERHRVAEREYVDILTTKGTLEKELPKHLRKTDIRPRMGVNDIVETDDPRWIAAEREVEDTSEKTVECSRALT